MAINFPNSPAINQTVVVGTDTWFWNGLAWEVEPVTLIPTQTGQSGKYLTTNGTAVSWSTVTATAASVGLGDVTNESKATMFASPTFTGTVSGVTATHVGLGDVTNESKATMFASPTFTGTVSGVTATHVGLGNVANESKATMFASPTFTGTVAAFSSATHTLTASSNLVFTGSTSGSVTFAAGATPAAQTYTLPAAYPGVNGYALTSTTAGVLSWAAAGGGGSTVVLLSDTTSAFAADNRYSDDSAQDPPTGPTAGNIIQLPVVEVGATYKILCFSSAASYDCWALQLPAIAGTDASVFVSNALQSIQLYSGTAGQYPVFTENNSFFVYSSVSAPASTMFIYGALSPTNAFEITRTQNVTVPGFGTLAIFTPTTAATFRYYDPAPDHFVYPFTQLLYTP